MPRGCICSRQPYVLDNEVGRCRQPGMVETLTQQQQREGNDVTASRTRRANDFRCLFRRLWKPFTGRLSIPLIQQQLSETAPQPR